MTQQKTADEQLDELEQRIEEWRHSRPKRRAMPEALWAEAARLAREVGPYRVVRATRVNHASLTGRLPQARERRPGGSGFVELSGRQLLAAGGGDGCVLEIESADGMRLRLEAGRGIDVAAVVAAFGRRP